MEDKALIGQGVPEVHPVGGDQHGHDAPQQRRGHGKADYLVPQGGGLGKGDEKHDENLHGAQVKGQRFGVQSKAPQRGREHMGHHFAALAENGNDTHHGSRGFGADVLFLRRRQSQRNAQGAQPQPDKMITREQE